MNAVLKMSRKALVMGVLLTTVLWSMMAAALVAPLKASAAGCASGSLIKGPSLPAVYYCGADGKRYVFTNDKNYFTWYSSFSNIQVLSDFELAGIPIGGNVTYRPGIRMVKIQSDPKTYAVAHGGSLRWVQTEALASCLWGTNWNQQIDDISDAFFVNYTVGFPITSCADYNRTGEMSASQTINQDKSLTPEVPVPPSVTAVSPASGATNVSVGTNLTATFSEAMNASTLNTGTFLLMKGSASVAGSVTYSGNTATFNPNVNLDVNSTYTATVTTGARDLDGNGLSGNYTWSFTTGPSPIVVSTSPASGALNVSVTANVTATFNEAMNASTLNTGTFLLAKGSTSVAGTVTYSNNTATFNPNASLDADSVYTATLTSGVRDADGNVLSGGYSWSFTTGPSPIVVSTSPVNGGANVALNADITAVFSETMNASTIDADTFLLMTGSATVAGTVTYSGTTATFNPSANLAADTVYTAKITTGAKDTDGNALASEYVWSFTTVP